jgi:hypothetical protein
MNGRRSRSKNLFHNIRRCYTPRRPPVYRHVIHTLPRLNTKNHRNLSIHSGCKSGRSFRSSGRGHNNRHSDIQRCRREYNRLWTSASTRGYNAVEQ